MIAPGLRYSQLIWEEALKEYVQPNSRWLDLGCGHKMLPDFRRVSEEDLVARSGNVYGIDYDLPNLQKKSLIRRKVRGDIRKLPFREGAFDLVTANMVVEHLDDPVTQFIEISRVIRPGGFFLFHTPNTKGYTTLIARLIPELFKASIISFIEGRKQEDVFRTFYRANSSKRIRFLAQQCGFELCEEKMLVTNGQLSMIPPFLVLELFWIRLLMTRPLKRFRTNMICALRRPKQDMDGGEYAQSEKMLSSAS